MQSWTRTHSILLVCVPALVAMATEAALRRFISIDWLPVALIFGLVSVLAVIGHGLNGRISGVLIDDRNRYSASRLQLLVWNVILLASVGSVVMHNLAAAMLGASCQGDLCTDPLRIGVPLELWALAGITNATGFAAPALLRHMAGDATDGGKSLNVKDMPGAARISDLFTGELKASANTADIPRIQQLLFTVLLAGGYFLSNLHLLFEANLGSTISALPSIGQGFLALLSVSSAVFVGGKAIPISGPGFKSQALPEPSPSIGPPPSR